MRVEVMSSFTVATAFNVRCVWDLYFIFQEPSISAANTSAASSCIEGIA